MLLPRAALLLCAGAVVVAMTLASGAAESKVTAKVMVLDSSKSLVLDPVVFGSSVGKPGLKSAPTTWSSRSNVRWNARWDINGRYLV